MTFRRLLFEEKQHLGDCALTGRSGLHIPPPRIAVNNHQEEKQ